MNTSKKKIHSAQFCPLKHISCRAQVARSNKNMLENEVLTQRQPNKHRETTIQTHADITGSGKQQASMRGQQTRLRKEVTRQRHTSENTQTCLRYQNKSLFLYSSIPLIDQWKCSYKPERNFSININEDVSSEYMGWLLVLSVVIIRQW